MSFYIGKEDIWVWVCSAEVWVLDLEDLEDMDNCSWSTTSGLICTANCQYYKLFTARILYIRLLYLMRLLQYSNCGGYGLGGLGAAGGVGGGFSNYFSGGYRFTFIDSLMNLTL